MTAPVGLGTVYQDLHVGSDHIQNMNIADMYEFNLGEGFKLTDRGGRGELSTATTSTGDTYYVGGFMQSEAPGPGLETGEVGFHFNKENEVALLDQLKKAGLIPDHIQSFEELGPSAIGVIENGVETGVLDVTDGGELVVGDTAVDPEFAQAGAKNESFMFADGTKPVDSFTAGETTVYKHQDGSFHIQNDDQEPVWIDSKSFDAAGFEDGEPTAEEVSNALGDGRLKYNATTNELTGPEFTHVDGTLLDATDSAKVTDKDGNEVTVIQTDKGFFVSGDDGKFVHVNSLSYDAVGLEDGTATVDTVAEKFEAGELKLDDKGNVYAPGLTAHTYDSTGVLTGSLAKRENGFWLYPPGKFPEGGIHVNQAAFEAAGFGGDGKDIPPEHVAEAINDGWIVYDPVNNTVKPSVVTPSNGFPAFTPTPENTFIWSDPDTGETYRVMKDPNNNNAFYIQKDGGPAVWVDSASFKNAEFEGSDPTAEEVFGAFRDGKLSFDGQTVTLATTPA